MTIDQKLYNAAAELANSRYPKGWGAAAAMYTTDGNILTSVYVACHSDQAELCIETGCICEAHKLGVAITGTICLSREVETEPFVILAPCGICQERLAYWGGDVQVAVPRADDPTKWLSVPLREVQPYYWHKIFESF